MLDIVSGMCKLAMLLLWENVDLLARPSTSTCWRSARAPAKAQRNRFRNSSWH